MTTDIRIAMLAVTITALTACGSSNSADTQAPSAPATFQAAGLTAGGFRQDNGQAVNLTIANQRSGLITIE